MSDLQRDLASILVPRASFTQEAAQSGAQRDVGVREPGIPQQPDKPGISVALQHPGPSAFDTSRKPKRGSNLGVRKWWFFGAFHLLDHDLVPEAVDSSGVLILGGQPFEQ